MEKDAALKAWVADWLRAHQHEHGGAPDDAFLDSEELRVLTAVFKIKLAQALEKFASAPPITPPITPSTAPPIPPLLLSVPMPIKLPDLSPTPGDTPLPAIQFRLPNARAGNAYAEKITAADAPAPVVLCAITVPPALEMAADQSSAELSGTPAAAGEYQIVVAYHLQNESPNEQREAVVKLTVNPDPKSLWKNLPSDAQAPYWRPDEACASQQSSDMRIITASKRGRSHAHVGSFRDDDVAIGMVSETGWHIVAVADGAGSAKFSRQGAALICRVARERLEAALAGPASAAIDAAAQACHAAQRGSAEALAEAQQQLRALLCGVVGNAAYYAAKAIMDECASCAPELQAAFKDFSSTALIAICKRYPFGTLCAAYWVGDGAIGVYSKTGGVTLLGDVDSGEYSGQTRFLESAEVSQEALLRRTRFALVDDMTALILMTDGVSDPKFETEARLARAADWDALWQDLDDAVDLSAPGAAEEKAEKLLAWLDFWSQGNHDDRTIAIIQ